MKKIVVLFLVLCNFFCVSQIVQADYSVESKPNITESVYLDKIKQLSNYIVQEKNNGGDNIVIAGLYRSRGGYYKKIKNYTMALEDFNKALRYNPKDLTTIESLKNLKLDIKDYSGALQDTIKLISLQPNNPEYYLDRAYIYFELKQVQQGIDDCTKAIVLKPKNPNAFELRGQLKILNNQVKNGIKDLEYAKQQYYELELYDDYRSVVEFLNTVSNLKNNRVNRSYSNQIVMPQTDYTNTDELRKMNQNLKSINRTLYMFQTN